MDRTTFLERLQAARALRHLPLLTEAECEAAWEHRTERCTGCGARITHPARIVYLSGYVQGQWAIGNDDARTGVPTPQCEGGTIGCHGRAAL